jgi:hypothetical protein
VNPGNLSFKLKLRAFFQKKKKKKNYQARQVFIICDFHISFLCFFNCQVKKATIDGQLWWHILVFNTFNVLYNARFLPGCRGWSFGTVSSTIYASWQKKKKKKPFKIPFLILIVYTRYDKRKKQESFHKKKELSQLSCDIFRSY